MHNTALLGITVALVILGSTSFAFAEVDIINDYKKITMATLGTNSSSTIGYEAGDLFGYKSTNVGDIDGNGVPDIVTVAFEADGIGYNEKGNLHEQLGTVYLILLNENGSVYDSHELSNCAASDLELRETRTFGENLDYLGVINGKPTVLISDYWFSKIHVISIDASNYSHSCSSFTVSGLDDLGWPFTVVGDVATDGNLSTVPDLIVGASVWDGEYDSDGEEIRYRDLVGIDLYTLDLTVDPTTFDITATKQIIDNSLLDDTWALRLFENVVVADIDGVSTTTNLVLGEPRVAKDSFTDGNTTGNTIHVATTNQSHQLTGVTTIEFENLSIALNQNKDPNFGIGLANLGDLNNDGVDDIAVGLEFLDRGSDNSGGVAIMFLNGDGSVKKVYLIANGVAPYALADSDYFGKGLESIDLNDDGFSELIASAHEDDAGGIDAGAVYVLTLDDSELSAVNYNMTPTPIILNPTFDNFYTQVSSFVNYAYADDSQPAFGFIPLPFTSTTTQVDDVTTLQTIDFNVTTDDSTYCDGLTIDELISNGNYTVFDNRDGSLGSKVKGTSGNDLMIASDNGDTLIGKSGDDCMIGGSGDDTLKGKKGNDIIYGNDGNDLIRGNQGDDTIFGGEGNDELHGGKGADTITGGLGDDILRGKKGSDTLNGGLGNDDLFGGKDNDFLYGNEGDDTLNGRKGIDTCDGGIGNNTIKNCEL